MIIIQQETNIHGYLVQIDSSGIIKPPPIPPMRGIGQIQLNKLVISMRWLNEENLIILTGNDEILICNGWPLNISETIWPIKKQSQQSSYNNLSTLISPKTPICCKINIDFFIRHQYFAKNIISFKNCLEIIGGLDRTGQTNKLLIITNSNIVLSYCMTWYDRIDKLIREGEWIKACCLIIEFYNKFKTGEIQSSANVNKLMNKIDEYIIQFCQFVVQSNKISDDELESFGGVAMDYCVNLNRCGSLLFDKVYKILLNNGGREIFFKLLEPYILNDKIQTLFTDYKILRHLLALDLREVLFNIIKIAFDDKHLFAVKTPIKQAPPVKQLQQTPNNNNPKGRRTSIQMKSMLSNAQSAVMTGAKWAWSLSSAMGASRNNSPNISRRNSSSVTTTTTTNRSSIEYEYQIDILDATIQLKSKQEMFDILVKIIINEGNDDNLLENELKLIKKCENEIFYEFCTPLLASGECEVDIQLLKCVLNYLFEESIKLLNKIEKLEKENETKDAKKKREFSRLIETKYNFENTILILLSRKMEENRGKHFNISEFNEILTEIEDLSFDPFIYNIKDLRQITFQIFSYYLYTFCLLSVVI